MQRSSSIPFDFVDLTGDTPSEDHDDVFSAQDIQAAYDRGREDALTQAENSALQAQTELLARIENNLLRLDSAFQQSLEQERCALRAITEAFLRKFCQSYGEVYDAASAKSLLNQFLEYADGQSHGVLEISGAAPSTIDQLTALINEQNITALVTVAANDTLKPGEARIRWRGGSLAFDLTAVEQAVSHLVGAERPNQPHKECSHES